MKKNWQHLWSLLFNTTLLVSTVAFAPALVRAENEISTSGGPDVPPESCFYFEHAEFEGQRNDIPLEVRRNLGDEWNDRISSIACSNRCRLQVFEHRDFAGETRSFASGSASQYVGDAWNDRISSMIVICEARPKGSADCTFGPDTCEQGFVWREAVPNDHVCVTPQVRQQTRSDNDHAAEKRIPTGDTCLSGFVWREAFSGDHVCVTPQTRAQAAQDNSRSNIRDACP